MSLFTLRSKVGDFNRLRRILTIIFEAGGGILIKKIRLKYLVPFSCRVHCFFFRCSPYKCLIQTEGKERAISSRVLREVLEKLGPTFVKLGQVLSLRSDIVGEEISQGLSKLQSDVSPFSYEQVRLIIFEEFGKEPEKLFKSIENKSFAAASLAQVHRAFLKDGTEVAVKVQRPYIRKVIEQDIHILFYLAKLVERFIPELRPYQPIRVVEEFADWTLRELDFKVEANNAERFRFAFKENPHIKIPIVYWEYTTSRVLTMEFVHGVEVNNFKAIKKLGVNPRELALYGVGAIFQEFLIDGFFHADPHPGNFFVLKNDILCLHDFGMVGYLTQQQRQELISCFVAFTDKDIDNFFKHFMHLAIVSEQSNVIGFQKDAGGILSEFFFSPNQPSVARSFFRIINKGSKHNISFPSDLALFCKAIITAEAMGLKLYPKFNFNKELQPFVDKVLRAYLDPRHVLRTFKTAIFDYLEFIKTFPELTKDMFQKIEKGEINVKLDTSEFIGFKEGFDRQNDLRILGMALVSVFLVTAGFLFLEGKKAIGGVPISTITIVLFIVLSIWFVIKIRKS